MNKIRHGLHFVHKIDISAVAAILIIAPASLAADSTADGSVQSTTTSNQTGDSRRILNGSAKQSLPLRSSVRLVPPNQAAGQQRSPQFQYTYKRLIYIQNAPVIPFARVRHESVYPRARTEFPAQTAQTQAPVEPAPKAAEQKGPPEWSYTMTPPNGIMSWAPGYESAAVPQLIKPSASATIASGVSPTSPSWIRPREQPLSARPIVAQLRSTPRLLGEPFVLKEKPCTNWNEWYKRVCRTVYDQWSLDDTGPGKACVHVTVWSSRDIDCKVVELAPAPDTSPDSMKEALFGEAALRAVKSLDRCAVLEFPSQPRINKIAFDLNMSRAVSGPAGYQVVTAHSVDNARTRIP